MFHVILSNKIVLLLDLHPNFNPNNDRDWKHDSFVHFWKFVLFRGKGIFMNFTPANNQMFWRF